MGCSAMVTSDSKDQLATMDEVLRGVEEKAESPITFRIMIVLENLL